MVNKVVQKLKQCVCDHDWEVVDTFAYAGGGVATLRCSKCGEEEQYEFEYEGDEDGSKQDAND